MINYKTVKKLQRVAYQIGGRVYVHSERGTIKCIKLHHHNIEMLEHYANKYLYNYIITGCDGVGYTAYMIDR